MAKARVPSRAGLQIHRLELLGAVLAARFASKIGKFLEIDEKKTLLWCDNASVLGWERDKPEWKWKAFVANRTKEIRSLTETDRQLELRPLG